MQTPATFEMPKKSKHERNADELGHDRERVQDEQIDDAEGAPELAEALEDQPCVTDAGHGAQPQHHFLIDEEHGHEQQHGPQQGGAVVLSRLRVGAEGAGIVIADHHDEAGPENREQRAHAGPPAVARRGVVMGDGAERALDVAEVRVVENGAARW